MNAKCDNCGDAAIYTAFHFEAGGVSVCRKCLKSHINEYSQVKTKNHPEKEIQTHEKKTDIPEDMWEAVGALRGALGDNPCVILDEADPEDGDRHYFFSDPDLYGAIQEVVTNLPGKTFQGHSYVALAYALMKHGVVCEAAITDSTDYDGGKMLRGICRAFEDLHSPANDKDQP